MNISISPSMFAFESRPPRAISQVLSLAAKEIRDALRNRWFILFSALFGILTCALSYMSMAGTGLDGVAGFGRTAAGLINVVLLIVPLMALTIGSGTIAGERDRGTLEYLLTHPITRGELLVGKYIGSALALLAALMLGFAAGTLVASRSGQAQHIAGYLALIISTALLALAMLSVGVLISTLCRKGTIAVGVSLLTWFGLVFLTDLGLMGGAILMHLRAPMLFTASLINPLQVFKMSVLGGIHASLDVLGPSGAYAVQEYGRSLPLIFAGAMLAWIVIPAVGAYVVFTRGGDA